LLLSVTTPLVAQDVTIDSWVYASKADGSWQAGGDTIIYSDPACDYCGIELGVVTTVKENGVQVIQKAGSGIMDSASVEYDSPTIVLLNSVYDATSEHTWTDDVYSYDYFTEASITIPGIPNVSLLLINDTNPYSVAFTYYASSEMYSSTLVIGDQYAISPEIREPVFSGFNQTLFPGPLDPGGPTTPIVFQGYLAGYYFGGQSCYVTTAKNVSLSDIHNSSPTEPGHEDTDGLPVALVTTHRGSETLNTYSYCTPPVPASGAVQVSQAFGSIDTHLNPCFTVAECDITQIAEVNVYPIDPTTFPALAPLPGTNSDPMTPYTDSIATVGGTSVKTFQSMQVVYPALWLSDGIDMAVCNTFFQVGTLYLPAQGCIDLTLP
jgi:hypothetical protein